MASLRETSKLEKSVIALILVAVFFFAFKVVQWVKH